MQSGHHDGDGSTAALKPTIGRLACTRHEGITGPCQKTRSLSTDVVRICSSEPRTPWETKRREGVAGLTHGGDAAPMETAMGVFSMHAQTAMVGASGKDVAHAILRHDSGQPGV
ncbi:hypothetical protein ACJQWK_00922 [Exserohilum turcicum]